MNNTVIKRVLELEYVIAFIHYSIKSYLYHLILRLHGLLSNIIDVIYASKRNSNHFFKKKGVEETLWMVAPLAISYY